MSAVSSSFKQTANNPMRFARQALTFKWQDMETLETLRKTARE